MFFHSMQKNVDKDIKKSLLSTFDAISSFLFDIFVKVTKMFVISQIFLEKITSRLMLKIKHFCIFLLF